MRGGASLFEDRGTTAFSFAKRFADTISSTFCERESGCESMFGGRVVTRRCVGTGVLNSVVHTLVAPVSP